MKILLRNIYIVLIVVITIVFFSHKIIIKKTIEIFLSNIIEKKFLVERISIDISKSTIELHNIKISSDTPVPESCVRDPIILNKRPL